MKSLYLVCYIDNVRYCYTFYNFSAVDLVDEKSIAVYDVRGNSQLFDVSSVSFYVVRNEVSDNV